MVANDEWLVCPRPRPDAALRLVCLPFAGGGASAFRPWAARLGADVELWCAQLPGRERRFAEPAATAPAAVLAPLVDALRGLASGPLALFGHSMGALVAAELARTLVARGRPPRRLFVSAAAAPHLPPAERPDRLDDAGLRAWVHRLGGVPAELAANRDLLDLMLPTIRADLTLCARAAGRPVDPVPVPVTAFAAAGDPLVAVPLVDAWRAHTTAGFDLVVRPGGHFYLNDDPTPIIAAVRDTARRTAKAGVL